jgi:ABC-type lipoprotein export system ATPase subunit
VYDSSGSQWRKWDLHVHTPASLFHRYPGDEKASWENFLRDLEALPPEFKAIGVNDYIFLDGYKKLKKEQANGRLKNIPLLLPVIELRLDKFGGSVSHLSKVNFHVIFSEAVDANLIEDQFLRGLWTHYDLTPSYIDLRKTWKAHPTRESILELGKLIIATVPLTEQSKFGPPIMEGFGNLTFRQEQIIEALDKPYFQGKHLFAVGKAEWAGMKWNDNSIADKKNVINSVDIIFTAADSIEACEKARGSLRDQAVNHHLLDCSDAHSFSATTEKDRIGNCFTWIKADLTFGGLRHALLEFEDRVFVGQEPHKLKEVRQNRTHYIKSVFFRKVTGSSLEESWFDGEVPLNSGLVAIIGNKGSGKSALADTIGLLGNSHQDKFFSFLNETRFRDPKQDKAKHFEAYINWESAPGKMKTLDMAVSPQDIELVKYIPQNFLERICNDSENKEETDFDKELKKVIFSHVPEEEHLGQDSLDSLLSYKTSETYELINALRNELQKINSNIVTCEEKLSPDYRKQIQNSLEARFADLKAHEEIKPLPVEPPTADAAAQATSAVLMVEINAKKDLRKTTSEGIQQAGIQRTETNRLISIADKVLARIENFRKSYESFHKELSADLTSLLLEFDSIVQLTIKTGSIAEKRKSLITSKNALDTLLDPAVKNSLPDKLAGLDRELASLQSKLDEPSQRYQAFLKDLEVWTEKQQAITGNEQTPGTVIYFKNLLDEIDSIPAQLGVLAASRKEKSREIFQKISGLADTYRELYRAVKDFIQEHPVAKETLQLNFEVSVVDAGFESRFFDQVSRGVTGSFCGIEEGQKVLRNVIKKFDFNNWDHVSSFTDEIVDCLHHDRRYPDNLPVRVNEVMRKGYSVASLYDYIFSLFYLEPRYTLRLADKELSQLSPGEKGALLLIFYLLVDRGQIPLIIDQPEENLDNQTMFKLLVPCLKDAKKKRQVIIVTHNPNLAVVADAEQVIHSFLDKVNKNKMTYTSGALENPAINRKVLDVLEGTRPAFDNRADKYHEETA